MSRPQQREFGSFYEYSTSSFRETPATGPGMERGCLRNSSQALDSRRECHHRRNLRHNTHVLMSCSMPGPGPRQSNQRSSLLSGSFPCTPEGYNLPGLYVCGGRRRALRSPRTYLPCERHGEGLSADHVPPRFFPETRVGCPPRRDEAVPTARRCLGDDECCYGAATGSEIGCPGR